MGKYSLIALDIDGTLLNSRLELTEANIQAIRYARAAGKHVILSTGRCLSELRELLAQLPEIRYLVCENGSCVYDLKYECDIHADPIPAAQIREILRAAAETGAVVQAFHDNQSYFACADADWAEEYRVGNYREVFRNFSLFDVRLFERFDERPFRVEKINLYAPSAEAQKHIREMLEGQPLQMTESFGYMLEIVDGAANKGRGLRMLCDHLKLPIEETIAMGDSLNDVDVLRAAGLSAAMGNACPEAKAAADVIAPDCDHDGVARIIYDYLLADE